MKFDIKDLKWTREPADFTITENKIEIITKPHTDLWQRTYYHFRNDNAPVLQMKTDEKFFSFVVKTEFESKHRFDQCGVVMYLDSENWLKGSIEYENEEFQHLGSVVTNNGYSDWATTAIDASIKSMWYRFSRREDDYCIECSQDGINFTQMRICHMWNGAGEIQFGIYACSPEDSSFRATFTNMEMTECKWLAHDGQAPDEEQKKKVAFICVHNSCRSQIAEALGKYLASDVFESYSAGTETKPQINQDAVRIMKELYGIDMEQTQYSKLISDIPEPDIAISMGCNVGCPFIGRAFDDNWGLEDPTGKTDEDFKVIIAKIEDKILKLKRELM